MTLKVLAVDLERPHQRLLHALLVTAGLRDYTAVERWEDTARGDLVVSVGKAALDLWHQWGLIQVGHQHGQVFTRDGRTIMVLEHPGSAMQLGFVGRSAKDNMKADLARFRSLTQQAPYWRELMQMTMCGGCQRTRMKGGGGMARWAAHWPEELDGAGLCEEHYRKRGNIKSRWKKPRVDRSKREAQMPGQGEMWAGDGTRATVMKGRR